MERRYDKFLAYVEPLKSSLIAYCKQGVWHDANVEDTLQTALTTALAAFGQFEEGTHFRAWMFKHLQHAVWNTNRRAKLHARVRLEDLSEEPAGADLLEQEWAYHELLETPEALYESFDDRVRGAVANLPEKHREVFLLKAIGELSYREIAEVLHVPIGTVMGQLFRARQRLREALVAYATEAGWATSGGTTHEVP